MDSHERIARSFETGWGTINFQAKFEDPKSTLSASSLISFSASLGEDFDEKTFVLDATLDQVFGKTSSNSIPSYVHDVFLAAPHMILDILKQGELTFEKKQMFDTKLFLKIPLALGLRVFTACVTLNQRIEIKTDQTTEKLVKKVQKLEAVIEEQQKIIQQLKEPKPTYRFTVSGSLGYFFSRNPDKDEFLQQCHDLLVVEDLWYRDVFNNLTGPSTKHTKQEKLVECFRINPPSPTKKLEIIFRVFAHYSSALPISIHVTPSSPSIPVPEQQSPWRGEELWTEQAASGGVVYSLAKTQCLGTDWDDRTEVKISMERVINGRNCAISNLGGKSSNHSIPIVLERRPQDPRSNIKLETGWLNFRLEKK